MKYRPIRRAYASRSRVHRVLLTSLVGVALLLPAGARPTLADVQPISFAPVADSYVDASNPTRNYGLRPDMRADGSPVRTSYLRFDVQGATDFSSATLRIYVEAGSNVGFDIRSVANTSWGETTITSSTAPPVGPVGWSSGTVNAGTWISADVSSLVTGNGPVGFALTTTDSTALRYTSRQGANPPQLIVPSPVSATSFTISRDGGTYHADSQPAGTSLSGSLKSVVEAAVIELDHGGGGTVTFGAGIFDYGSEFFDVNEIHNITFQGQGIDVTFIQNSSTAAADTEPFNFSGAFNVVIRDMTISAGGPPRTTSDVIDFDQGNDTLVERVKITGSRGRGIIIDGKDGGWTAERNVIRDCFINGLPSDGIELLAAGFNLVENCVVTNVGGHGIQITKSSTSAPQPNKPSSDNILRNNTIDNSGQDGINVNSGDRNQITGNTITNSSNITASRDGIRIGAADSIPCNDNMVNGNVATDTQATKTQAYGLNISSALCHRTVVGVSAANNFAGNRVGAIRDLASDTIYPPPVGDTQPPTQPTGLNAVAASACRIDLAWSASTDNVGVTGYGIYRDGALIASVGGSTLSFQDTAVSPSTAYSYAVDAVDAATNRSPQSEPDAATTPSAACSLTFVPIADSYVDASQPAANFGTSTQVRVDGSPVISGYLKFDVQVAGPISRATLRIFANSNHSLGFSVRPVDDTSWGETAITSANAPAYGAIAGSSGPLTSGTWVDVDVTSLVVANGQRSLALTTTSSTAISLASRQSGANAPQLIIETN